MNEFKKIDNVLSYVKNGLLDGTFSPVKAVKFARIIARPGTVGEEVVSWSEKDGEPIIEKVATVSIDPKTGNPGWVVTKAEEDGTPVIDKHGHTNDWIIEDSKFVIKYELKNNSVYRPTGGEQIFVKLNEDITMSQWGGEYNIGAGGYINITNLDDIYGISERDFNDTYKIVGPASIKKLS